MSKLLIVDDDIRLRKLVRTYGEVEHYECDEAADGLAALEKLQNDHFDLVILDVMMPGLDGFETLERIRKTSEIPVIMLTARNEEYDSSQALVSEWMIMSQNPSARKSSWRGWARS